MVSISLLLFSGVKVPIEIDNQLASKIDFTQDVSQFTVNDLVDYLFTYWDEIFSSSTTESPTYISQIQLLHLGVRLQPNTKIISLNLTVSSIIHLVLKPVEMVRDRSESTTGPKSGFFKKIIRTSSRGTNEELVYTKRSEDGSTQSQAAVGAPKKVRRKSSVNDAERIASAPSSSDMGQYQAESDAISAKAAVDYEASGDVVPLEDLNSASPAQASQTRQDNASHRRSSSHAAAAGTTISNGSSGCCSIV